MEAKLIHKGIWFIPENKNTKYGGTLSIKNNNKISLELLSIEKDNNHLFDFSPEIILGFGLKNEKITLIEPFKSKGIHSAEGVINWKIDFKYCIIGKHFDSLKKLVFNKIHLDINTFSEWVRFEFYNTKKNKEVTDKVLFKDENISINLWIHDRESIVSVRPPKKIIETKGILTLNFNSKTSLQELVKKCKYLTAFICIGTNQASFINQLSYLDESEEIPIGVKFFIDDLQFSSHLKFDPNSFLFHFDYISDKIDTIFKFWFTNQSKLQPIVELLLNSYYSNMINDWGLFMNLISSLESFHREFVRNNDEQSINKFEQILDAITDEELTKWLNNKKIIFKSVSLPNRIVDLCEDENLGLVKKINKFKRVVSDTRNMFAHNLQRHSKIADEFEIHLINGVLKLLLEFHILKETGIDKTKLIEKFVAKKDYKSILNLKEVNKFEKY